MTDKEAMQMALETLDNMIKVDWREWDEFASVEDFVRWAKSRASFTAEALRARLAQPEPAECDGGQCGIGGYCKQCPKTQPKQEPVAWISCNAGLYHGKPDESLKPLPLYTASSQREWVGLTDEEYETMAEQYVTNCYFDTLKYAKAIEAKLKEKNT